MTIRFFDTTLRDGLLSPTFNPRIEEQYQILETLDLCGFNTLEIGHAGVTNKEEIQTKVSIVQHSEISILSDLNKKNIDMAVNVLRKSTQSSLLNLYSNTNIDEGSLKDSLNQLNDTLAYATKHHPRVQWTGFDVNRSSWNILEKHIQCALDHEIEFISYADSLGVSKPENFRNDIRKIINTFPNIKLSIHCHDDLGHALDNTINAIEEGAIQIEASILGVGARKGNTNIHQCIKYLDSNQKKNINTSKIHDIENFTAFNA